MSVPLLVAEDFGTYLNVELDQQETNRAQQILGMAQVLCESIVSPLPEGAEAVILDVAIRAWSNPRNVNAEQSGAGPFSDSTTFGAVSGGLWLTRQNKATLRRLAGKSGAFSIDMLPATAGQNLPWWDSGATRGYDTDTDYYY